MLSVKRNADKILSVASLQMKNFNVDGSFAPASGSGRPKVWNSSQKTKTANISVYFGLNLHVQQ